jgi:hypothetical protein
MAQAQQGDAPALWTHGDVLTAAWVGEDHTDVHQDAVQIVGDTLGQRVILPLPPVHPYAQQSAPAPGGGLHLLWLDQSTNGDNHLFSALIGTDLTIQRGPISVSDRLTLRYAAVSGGDGSVWTAWSGGLLSEPTLYTQLIDPEGRPRPAQQIATNADWPALVRTNGGALYAFWLSAADGQVYRARLAEGAAQDVTLLSAGVRLLSGDRLHNVSAGLDAANAYLFINLTRADGTDETWMASGSLAASSWAQPRRMTLGTSREGTFDGGFGMVDAAREGDIPLRWAAPLASQHDALPVAALVGDTLGVIYMQAGEPVGYEAVTPVSRLVGVPGLVVSGGRLALAWAEPTPNGHADLKLTVKPA